MRNTSIGGSTYGDFGSSASKGDSYGDEFAAWGKSSYPIAPSKDTRDSYSGWGSQVSSKPKVEAYKAPVKQESSYDDWGSYGQEDEYETPDLSGYGDS